MKNKTKVIVGIALAGLLYGSFLIHMGHKVHDERLVGFGEITIFSAGLFVFCFVADRYEKRIKEWLRK